VTSLRILVLALGVALGVLLPFISVILASFGFGPGQIGLIASLSAVAFTIAVPTWGHLADVRLGRPRTLQICVAGAAIALLLLLGTWPPVVIALLFIANAVFQSSWQPLTDAITVNALRDRSRGYARVRLLTSLSFAIGTVAAGFAYERTGYALAFVLCAGFAMVMAIAAAGIPDAARANLAALRLGTVPRPGADASATAEPSTVAEPPTPAEPPRPARGPRTWQFGSASVALRIAPRLGLVLAAVGLVHIGMISGYTFLSLRIVQLGGGPSDVALSAGLSAAAEIPSMAAMGWIVSRIGLRGVFTLSALIYAVCFASWAVLEVPALIIATRVFTGMAFAGVVVGVVLTIATLLPTDLQATGQSLFQTTAFGLAAIVSNVIGGFLYSTVEPAAVFGLGAILAVAAAVLGWFAFPRGGPSQVRQSRS
jgi:MFS transporter, PPP family, 3-phenylpropionic acid transporter